MTLPPGPEGRRLGRALWQLWPQQHTLLRDVLGRDGV